MQITIHAKSVFIAEEMQRFRTLLSSAQPGKTFVAETCSSKEPKVSCTLCSDQGGYYVNPTGDVDGAHWQVCTCRNGRAS